MNVHEQHKDRPLQDRLAIAEASGLIRVARLEPELEYLFRHALVEDAAYYSLLRQTRIELHRAVAEVIEQSSIDQGEDLAAHLAHHYEHGQVWDKAITYMTQAAEQASHRFALQESLSFYDRAIRLVENHPESVSQQTLLILHERRGEANALVYQFEEAEADLSFVLEAIRQSGDLAKEQALLIKLGYMYRTADRLDKAAESLNRALEVARARGDLHSAADTLYHLGTVAWSLGENNQAGVYHEEALALSRELGLADVVAVQALHGRAEAYWIAGRVQDAFDLLAASCELARQIGDQSYECENLYMMAAVSAGGKGIGDYRRARQYAEQALAISQAAGMDGHTAPALLAHGWAVGFAGDYRQGLEDLKQGIALAEGFGVARFLTIASTFQGELFQDLNLLEKAQEAHARGLALAVDRQIGTYLVGLQANLAIDRLRLGDLSVGADLEAALASAEAQDQGLHAARCLEGLAEMAVARSEPEYALGYCIRLSALGERGGMHEAVAQSLRWRGEALLAMDDLVGAQQALQHGLAMAETIGRMRLLWDIHAALAKLCDRQGQAGQAAGHQAAVREIVTQIRHNLRDAELELGLPQFG